MIFQAGGKVMNFLPKNILRNIAKGNMIISKSGKGMRRFRGSKEMDRKQLEDLIGRMATVEKYQNNNESAIYWSE